MLLLEVWNQDRQKYDPQLYSSTMGQVIPASPEKLIKPEKVIKHPLLTAQIDILFS